jgi:hypothetical protein
VEQVDRAGGHLGDRDPTFWPNIHLMDKGGHLGALGIDEAVGTGPHPVAAVTASGRAGEIVL